MMHFSVVSHNRHSAMLFNFHFGGHVIVNNHIMLDLQEKHVSLIVIIENTLATKAWSVKIKIRVEMNHIGVWNQPERQTLDKRACWTYDLMILHSVIGKFLKVSLRPRVRKYVISIYFFKAYARSATNGSDIARHIHE